MHKENGLVRLPAKKKALSRMREESGLVRLGLPVALYKLSSEYIPNFGLAFLWQGWPGQLAIYKLSSEYFPSFGLAFQC